MRGLDPRYDALRVLLCRYEQEYLSGIAKRRNRWFARAALLLVAAAVCLMVGAWFARTNYVITFITL